MLVLIQTSGDIIEETVLSENKDKLIIKAMKIAKQKGYSEKDMEDIGFSLVSFGFYSDGDGLQFSITEVYYLDEESE